MTFLDEWDKEVQQKRIENIDNVLYGDFDMEKLLTHANNMGITKSEFLDALAKGNRHAAYILAIDPVRQNLQEGFQAKYINERVGYKAVVILPKKNKNVYEKDGIKTRTTDAVVTSQDKARTKYNATFKLISGTGGAQDNQRREVQKWLETASEKSDRPVIALVDDTNPRDNEWYFHGVKDRNRAWVFNSDGLVDFINYRKDL